MRKILIVILLFCSLAGRSQLDYFTVTGNDGFLIGMAEHLAPTNAYGNKDPWIIYLHGIDHLRAHPINANDTTRITVLSQKGVPKLVANTPLPYFHKPGGGSNAYYRWNVIAPQGDSDDSQWKVDKLNKCLDHIRTHAATTDTSLIIVIGYSLGGGGCFSMLRFSTVYPYIKYVFVDAGGYINTPDYPTLAGSAMNIDVISTAGDQLASVTLSDNWVAGIKGNNPIIVPNFIRLIDLSPTNNPTDHDLMVQRFIEDTTAGDTYTTTNGDTWTRTETPYERGLRFFGPKRLDLLPLFAIPIFPYRRRRKKKLIGTC